MSTFENFFRLSLASLLRDRLLYLLCSLALLALVIVPAFSMFSLRQVQELSITLSLSALSLLLLTTTILTGSSSIWRDVERRYTSSALGLPVSRASFVLAKFSAISLLLALLTVAVGVGGSLAILVSVELYPADIPVSWGNLALAAAFNCLKYVMLLSLAFLFSAVSTSFYFPFLATFAVFLAGSATQEVFELVQGEYGSKIAPFSKAAIEGCYYVLPNFSAFDLGAHAIYALPLAPAQLLLTLLYFVCYTGIVLSLAVWSFSRRELP